MPTPAPCRPARRPPRRQRQDGPRASAVPRPCLLPIAQPSCRMMPTPAPCRPARRPLASELSATAWRSTRRTCTALVLMVTSLRSFFALPHLYEYSHIPYQRRKWGSPIEQFIGRNLMDPSLASRKVNRPWQVTLEPVVSSALPIYRTANLSLHEDRINENERETSRPKLQVCRVPVRTFHDCPLPAPLRSRRNLSRRRRTEASFDPRKDWASRKMLELASWASVDYQTVVHHAVPQIGTCGRSLLYLVKPTGQRD
jgi:hypothetical protein